MRRWAFLHKYKVHPFLARTGILTTALLCRGSLGFGEDCVQSLLGNIGTSDVADCIAALDAAIEQGLLQAHPFMNNYVLSHQLLYHCWR